MEGYFINRNYFISFVLLNFVFAVFINIAFGYIKYFEQIEKGHMLYINMFARKIHVEDADKFIRKLKTYKTSDSYIIWQKLSDNLVGLVYYGNFESPPIVEGRFFVPSDFYCNNKLAVIGKNMSGYVSHVGNASFINIFNEQYKVIGVTGHDYPSNLDYAIYFNLDSGVMKETFYIDGKNPQKITKIINEFAQIASVKEINDPLHGIGRLFGYSSKNDHLKAIGILICLTSAVLSTMFFTNANLAMITVQHLFGISAPFIIFRLVLKLYTYSGIILLIGMTVIHQFRPYFFAWQKEIHIPQLLLILAAFYLFPQLLGMPVYMYGRIRRIF